MATLEDRVVHDPDENLDVADGSAMALQERVNWIPSEPAWCVLLVAFAVISLWSAVAATPPTRATSCSPFGRVLTDAFASSERVFVGVVAERQRGGFETAKLEVVEAFKGTKPGSIHVFERAYGEMYHLPLAQGDTYLIFDIDDQLPNSCSTSKLLYSPYEGPLDEVWLNALRLSTSGAVERLSDPWVAHPRFCRAAVSLGSRRGGYAILGLQRQGEASVRLSARAAVTEVPVPHRPPEIELVVDGTRLVLTSDRPAPSWSWVHDLRLGDGSWRALDGVSTSSLVVPRAVDSNHLEIELDAEALSEAW